MVFGVPVTLLMCNYNYGLTNRTAASTATCTGPSGPRTLAPASTNTNYLQYAQATCRNYAITAVDVNGVDVVGTWCG